MAKQDIAIKVLQQVVKLPVVKVNREKFLVEKFSKEGYCQIVRTRSSFIITPGNLR